MAGLVETLTTLTESIRREAKQGITLEEGLFSLQRWVELNATQITAAERVQFSTLLTKEQAPVEAGQGSDQNLIASVMRLHLMRLLFRMDAQRRTPLRSEAETAYDQAKLRLMSALQETEDAVNEARIDAAIANAHQILADKGANRRWLNDALMRLQAVAGKDLQRLAQAIPQPEIPAINPIRRLFFWLYGIRPEEMSKRTLNSLHKLATLQTEQIVELTDLLIEAFTTLGDSAGVKAARAMRQQLGGPTT